MDSRLIFPHHVRRSEVRRDAFWKGIGVLDIPVAQARGHIRFRSPWKERQEKPMLYNVHARTKTDTGRRDEYSKALERTLVKELCNMAP